MISKTNRDRYFCRSCGGVTVYLTAQEAEEERAQGHEIEISPNEPATAEVRS